MQQEKSVYLIGGSDDEVALIKAEVFANNCNVSIGYRGKRLSENAPDCFEALSLIRNQMETEGLIPFCYGSSLTVFPSGMARDMGKGLKAYRLKLGVKPTMSDLVHILDAGPDVIPAYVRAQRQYFESWIKSITPPAL